LSQETHVQTLEQQLGKYALFHRDRRNIATHFVGVPMIVVAVAVLLARPSLLLGGIPLSMATFASLAAALYYLRLDLRLGILMTLLLALSLAFAQWSAAQSFTLWLTLGAGLFVAGWIIQFVGHYFEGRKPAFVDDLTGLIIGPLFVAAEAVFALGLRKEVEQAIISVAGPTHGGTQRAAAAP
jgi:uncharacterized membrane protein YGL010W